MVVVVSAMKPMARATTKAPPVLFFFFCRGSITKIESVEKLGKNLLLLSWVRNNFSHIVKKKKMKKQRF